MNKYIMQRGWMDHPAFALEPFTEREAFCWLIENAVWQDGRVRCGNVIVSLKRGQLAYSIRFLAQKWAWHKSKVERFLNRLKTETLIETDTRQLVSIVTICQYNELQDFSGVVKYKNETANETVPRQYRDSTETKKNTGITPDNTGITPEPSVADATDSSTRVDGVSASEPIAEPRPAKPDDSADLADAVAGWNALAGELGLPAVQRLTEARKSKLRARLRDAGGLVGWDAALAKIRGSPFCRGEKCDFRADFDFVLQEKSFTKLLEGAYDANANNPKDLAKSNGWTQLMHEFGQGAAL